MYETVAIPVKKGPNFQAIRDNLWFRAMKGKYMVLDDTFDPKLVPAGRQTIRYTKNYALPPAGTILGSPPL